MSFAFGVICYTSFTLCHLLSLMVIEIYKMMNDARSANDGEA